MASAWYVYAITRRGTPLPEGDTAATADLVLVPSGALAAVARRTEGERAAPTVAAVLQHEAVVEAVRRQGAALPVRFGTVFGDAESVAAALAEREAVLVADLERLGDKVELGLTAFWATPPHDAGETPPASDDADGGRSAGARYLRARAAELRTADSLRERARAVAEELDQALSGVALERRLSLLPSSRVAVRAAYLLDRAGVSDFKAVFGAIRGRRTELRVLLTGPWPPYSFVVRTEAEAGIDPEAVAQRLSDVMQGRLG